MIIDSGIATGSLTVSGSLIISGSTIATGDITLTGSLSVTGGITGSISGVATSASYAVTASYAPDYLPLAGGTITGDLIVEGTASIAYLNVTFESASVIYSSGSNILGDTESDVQTFYGAVIIPTGSLQVTGSTSIDGDLTVAPGAYEVFHVHPSGVDITGSLTVDSDLTINANMYMLANKLIYGTASYANSTVEAPFYVLTASYNVDSASLSTRVTDLESWSSSLDSGFVTEAELSTATASLQAGVTASISDLSTGVTASISDLSTGVTASISDLSSSIAPQITTLTDASASFASKLDTVTTGSFTGSFTGDGSGLINVPASGIVGLQLNQIGSGSVTASIAPDKGFTVNTNTQITGSLEVTAGITGSFSGSLYNLQNITINHIPYFSQSQVLTDSAMFQVDNGLDQGFSIAINQNGVNTENPEALFVYQASTSSFNVISGKGNLNNYLQLNIQNTNNGANASSDVVATANNGDENSNFIDMGINGANFTGPIGGANDAYLYSTGVHLHIGNATAGQYVGFFAGGTDVDTNMKMILSADDLHEVTGSLNASNGFIGDLTGNADTATSASYAATASYSVNFTASNALVNNTLTAQTLIVQTVTSSIVYSSGSNIFGNQLSNSQEFTGSVTITGSLLVNGLTPVYTNQTSSVTVLSASYADTASYANTLDSNATASYANEALTASYAQAAPAYLTTASYLVDSASLSTRSTNLETTASNLTLASGSFSTRTTVLESASASFAVQSGSNSIRLTNLESTASTLTTASASFATVSASFSSTSGSLSTRTTNLESTGSQLITASGSLSTRTTNLESTASTLTTASASFTTVSASFSTTSGSLSTRTTNLESTASTLVSFSASYVVASGSSSTRVTNLETTASNLTTASGSFSTRTTNLESTASTLVSFSASYVVASGSDSGRITRLESTASTLTTASASFSTRTTNLESTASTNVTSINTLISVTGSYATTGSNTFKATQTVSGAVKYALTNDPDPTGADGLATYLFESASNTAYGRDLYIRQDGNISKWKWTESQLQTGLLYGGALNYSGSTIYVNSGSGIIVNYNAAPGAEASPTIQYLNWGPITASAAFLTSSTQTYVYIDSAGALQQQTNWFTVDQYANDIPLGVFYHGNKTSITSTSGDVATVYNTTNQSFDFIRAFGPLKLEGMAVGGNSGSMQLNISNGTAYVLGGFYQQDLNNVSHYTVSAQPTGSMARWYRSGSTGEFIIDNNGGAFYTTVDNTKYDNGTGTLATVGNSAWTVQRVFENPVTGRLAVYYGQKVYASLADTQAGLATDPFSEGTLTAHNNVFVAYLLLQGNASNTDITNAVNAIVQAGLFRNTAGSSGGTSFGQTLESLTDVTITTPSTGQALIYSGGTWVNGNPTTAATASYVLNAVSASRATSAATATTASYVTGSIFTNANSAASASFAQTASYVLQAVSASFATTALNAPFYVLTASFNTVSGSISTRVTNLESTASTLVSFSASYVVASGSSSTRVTNLESTASQFITTSGSLSTRTTNLEATASTLVTASGSLSTRTTNLESTASQFTTTSGSLSTRTTNLESTASTLVSFSASYAVASGSLSTRTTNLESTSSTLVNASASFVANYVKNSQTSSMSVLSASYALNALSASYAPAGFPYSGSAQITGSLGVTGSMTVSGSGTVFTLNSDVLEVTGSLVVSGSSIVTGSVSVLGSIKATSFTGSLLGTASTASYVLTAQTASYVLTAQTASYVQFAQTASYVLQAVSASFATSAATASFATNFTASNILVNGTVTAQTLNVQQVTSSIVYTSGSNVLGSLLTNTQQLTGSVTITGSLQVNGRTPLYVDQTASLTVISASYAATASYANSTAVIPFNIGGTSTYYGTVNSSIIGANNVFTLDTGSYRGAKFLYTIYSSSDVRTGEVLAAWTAGTATFTDISTLDIGNTSGVSASVSIVSSQVQLNFQANQTGWVIKSQGTLI